MTQADTKICSECHKVKPKSAFWHHPSSPDGLQYKCTECLKEKYAGKERPPLSSDQIKLLISMLDLLPDTVKDTSWIDGDQMKHLNPGLKNVGRLKTRGIVERRVLHNPTKGTHEYVYRLSEDGRTIAKGMEALMRKATES